MQTSETGMFVVSTIFPVVTSITILLRFRVRRKTVIGGDDWTILVALVEDSLATLPYRPNDLI